MAPASTSRSVRDAVVQVWRDCAMTTMFSNPGSTEIPLLAGLPDDIDFVLGLHEASVVGLATGAALARESPQLVVLHTTAGLGNAVGALATARVNRGPLVVVVGQQDRRHLAAQPFLAGRLAGLAGDYPVSVEEPVRAGDVPSAVLRAWHRATALRGPALVVVPMDDWTAPADDLPLVSPTRLVTAGQADDAALTEVARLVEDAAAPVLVVGSGADDPDVWEALETLADRWDAPVWQEPFGARAGFRQDHPRFAGHLPAGRARVRAVLAGHDLVVVIGAPAAAPVRLRARPAAARGNHRRRAHRRPGRGAAQPAALALVTPLASACRRLSSRTAWRPRQHAPAPLPRPTVDPPVGDEPLRAAHVFAALAERLPVDATVVEETPSSRPDLHRLLPARRPRGFVSAAMGGLGFALPAAIGLRMADPSRPVVAVVGDGSSLYAIQALWTAAAEGVGVVVVVLANGRYAVMDRLAEASGSKPVWPAFDEVDVVGLARSLGCPARAVDDHAGLLAALDEVAVDWRGRQTPLVLSVRVAPDTDFSP